MRVVLILIYTGFIYLYPISAIAQTKAGTASGGTGNSEMTGTFPSLESLSVKPDDSLEDSADAAQPRTINKKITYVTSELDDETSSQVIAYERVKREIIEELRDDVWSLYKKECSLNNAEPSLVFADVISLMSPLLYVEKGEDKWGNNQLEFEATATVSCFAIAKTLYILSNQEILLKHIKKNRKYADEALAKIEQLQNASYNNNQEEIQGSYDKAVNLLYATHWFEQGLLSDLAGEAQSAIDAYTKALELNPEFSEAFYHRASNYRNFANDNQKALSDYNQAIKLDNDEADYYTSRGVCHYNMDNLDLAMKDLNHVIELNPPTSTLYTVYAIRGNIYERNGEDQKALQDYSRAIEMNPKAVNVYYRKGLLNRRLKNYEESVEDFCNVIELDKNHSAAYHERGISYAFLGDKQKVLSDFKSAARLGNAEAREFLNSKNIKWEE